MTGQAPSLLYVAAVVAILYVLSRGIRFRRQPQPCAVCARVTKDLHKVNSVYFKQQNANMPRHLCDDCFVKQVQMDHGVSRQGGVV